MADESHDQGEERPRRAFQQFPQRSTASANWRMRDDQPRAEPQPRRPNQNRNSGSFESPRQQNETSSTRLYVGNLLYSAQKDDIASFFAENGFTVASVTMSIDPATGRNPSYCFVDFESAEDAARAISELNGKDVMGRAVRINPGVAKRAGEGSAPSQPRTYNNRGWRGDGQQQQDGFGQAPSYNNRWNNRNDSQSNLSSGTESATKRLYVGNLPAMDQPSAEAAITDLFTPLGVEVTSVSKLIAPHESKKDQPGDHHYLFVEVAKAEDIETVIQALDGKPSGLGGDGTLRVNKAREQQPKTGYGQRREGYQPREGYQQREGYQPREGYQQREGHQPREGYQSRRTEGARDWRRGNDGQENAQ